LSQSSSRFCSHCNSSLEPGHRFCTNCGATTSSESNAPTALTNDQSVLASESVQSKQAFSQFATEAIISTTDSTILTHNASAPGFTPATPQAAPPVPGATYPTTQGTAEQFYTQTTDAGAIPPPPPPESFLSTPQEAPAAPYHIPPSPGSKTVPDYAQAPKRSRGCLVVSIVLLISLVLGGLGAFYAFKSRFTSSSTQGQQNTPSSNSTTVSNSGITPSNGVTTTPSTGVPVTIPLNLKFTYSSVNITLVSVQQANSFADDSSISQGGIRVSMHESNPTAKGTHYVYSDVVRLILPEGTAITPNDEQYSSGPDSSVSRGNWLDFVMTNQTIDLNKLILRFGTPIQQQIDIPLTPGADLSKYQPVTVMPNVLFQYAGMNWTLTSAIESWSANAQQAATGQVFVTVMLKVDNPTSSEFNAYWGDYIRLKSGNTTTTPTTDTTLSLHFAAGSTGATGYMFFVMPAGRTSYTLLLLDTPSTPFSQATATFQFQ
jgi:hypothetical protein